MIKLYKTQHEYDTDGFDVGATSLSAGIPVALSSGKLVASATPDYVTLEPCDAGEANVIVHRIRKDELYSAKLSADGSGLNIGDAVTITTAGLATATTASGIFKIEEFKDATKASGTVVVGRFI